MRRGFLTSPPKSSSSSSSSSSRPTNNQEESTSPAIATLPYSRVVQDSPTIITTDSRLDSSKTIHYLYLPSPSHPNLVVMDYLDICLQLSHDSRWTTYTPTPSPSQALFRIALLDGKGRGLVATRDIAPGTLIHSEKPLFIARTQYNESSQDSRALYTPALSRLSSTSTASIFNLSSCYPPGSVPFDTLVGKLKTNYHGVDLTLNPFETQGHGGVFATLCLANHSCTPNAHYYFDRESTSGQIRALKEIKTGEEICIKYISPGLEQAARKSMLRQQFHFDCGCEACSLNGKERMISDRRRKKANEIIMGAKKMLGGALEDLATAMDGAKEGLVLEEGMLGFSVGQYLFMRGGGDLAGEEWVKRVERGAEVLEWAEGTKSLQAVMAKATVTTMRNALEKEKRSGKRGATGRG